jgi:hypothetical protein
MRYVAITNDETPCWAYLIKIDAVETARIPKNRTKNGDMDDLDGFIFASIN